MRRIIKIGFPILCISIIIGTFILLSKTAEKINKNKLVENDDENITFQDENTINDNASTGSPFI